MRIQRSDTVAVIVDVQERLFPHIHEHGQIEHTMRTLIRGLQILDIPIVLTEQYPKGLGPTIASIRELVPDTAAMEKMTFSCCGSEDFLRTLYGLGRNNVVLMGIEAHVCVMQTALDLLESGYAPVVVADAVSSRSLHNKDLAIARLRDEAAIITSCESLLFELCVVAGTDEFRQISQLVK